MKKFLAITVVSVLSLFLVSGNAMALSFGDGGTSLQQVLDDFTVGGPSSVDVTTDYLDDAYDSAWQLTATGGSVATIVIELAGNAGTNTFGVYQGNSYIELFNGASGQGDLVTFSLRDWGGVYEVEINSVGTGIMWQSQYFGYYLDGRDAGQGLFHSDSTLNAGGTDHMAAYQGQGDTFQIPTRAAGPWTPSEYILAWEDLLPSVSDFDYNDFVVMVESVDPVPEPGTLLLLGAGLIGLIGLGRKFKK